MKTRILEFLMYRVELKEGLGCMCHIGYLRVLVPNVPCGVESSFSYCLFKVKLVLQFLMYRVELKEYVLL